MHDVSILPYANLRWSLMGTKVAAIPEALTSALTKRLRVDGAGRSSSDASGAPPLRTQGRGLVRARVGHWGRIHSDGQ
jgi:hypothetical protein